MAMGEYHDVDNGRCESGWIQSHTRVPSQRKPRVKHCEPALRYLIQPFDI